MIEYETFEHESDIGIRGFGITPEEAFCHAAEAMYSVMVNVSAVLPKEKRTIEVNADDREQLLVEWLNALLARSDIERMVFSKFDVRISETALTGIAWGEPLDQLKHEPKVEVKGATYHMLSFRASEDGYVVECVVDV